MCSIVGVSLFIILKTKDTRYEWIPKVFSIIYIVIGLNKCKKRDEWATQVMRLQNMNRYWNIPHFPYKQMGEYFEKQSAQSDKSSCYAVGFVFERCIRIPNSHSYIKFNNHSIFGHKIQIIVITTLGFVAITFSLISI